MTETNRTWARLTRMLDSGTTDTAVDTAATHKCARQRQRDTAHQPRAPSPADDGSAVGEQNEQLDAVRRRAKQNIRRTIAQRIPDLDTR